MSQVKTSTVVLACVGTTLTGLAAYAVYFDYKRRNDLEFRRALKRESKREAKAAKEEAEGAKMQERRAIRSMVDDAVEEGWPSNADEKEQFFMMEVKDGETLCQQPGAEKEAASSFFKAMRVYPQPPELMTIYDKTVPKHILDILAEMEAYYRVAYGNGEKAGGSSNSSTAGVE